MRSCLKLYVNCVFLNIQKYLSFIENHINLNKAVIPTLKLATEIKTYRFVTGDRDSRINQKYHSGNSEN